MQASLILDFDSTFVQVEALDELAKIALKSAPNKAAIVSQIELLTRQGMAGTLSFPESLSRRLALFSPNVHHIQALVEQLESAITDSVRRHREFLTQNRDHIYLVSGGFREYIVPVVREFDIAPDHVYANRFAYDDNGNIAGCDTKLPLARDRGKVIQLDELRLPRPIVMVGDGASDLEVRNAGVADLFVAFTENVDRPGVTLRADHIANSFDTVVSIFEKTTAGRQAYQESANLL